jgi:HlyD family secretion protein
MRKRAFAWVGLVGLLAGLLWFVNQRGWLAQTPSGSQAGELHASGVIAASEIQLSSLHGGTVRVDGVYVAEGDAVQRDQELVALDTTLLEAQTELAEAQLAVAQAALQQMQAGARPGEVAAATRRLEQARAAQAAALQGLADARTLRGEPQQLDMQIALGESQVEAAESRLQSAVALKDAAEVGKQALQYAEDQIRNWSYPVPPPGVPAELKSALWNWWEAWAGVNAAQASVDDAHAQLAHWRAVREQPQELDARVQVAEASVAEANAAVDGAQAQLDAYRAGASAEQLDVARARVRQAQIVLDALVSQRQEWVIRAPVSGTVLSRAVHAGEVIAPGSTVLSLADLSQVKLTVYVAEDRLGEVALDQTVRVDVDALPGSTFEGRVTHIADEAQYTPRNVATQDERVSTVYAVEILLPNGEGLLRPGMTADAGWATGNK